MRIDILDKIVEQDILVHKITKIIYSFAFENCLKEKLLLLRKSYNIYSIDELFTDKKISITSDKNGKFKEWAIGIIKNALGLIPSYGSILTIVFSITDTVNYLKVSDIERLREHLQLKEKPYKKYKKTKNIIIVKNTSYLTVDETKKVRLIKELIEKKYIVNTVLIICEPVDFPSSLVVDNDAIYTISLDKDSSEKIFGYCLDDNDLKLINVLGIEYADYISNIEKNILSDNNLLMQKLISDMLHKVGYENEENFFEFLKLCSLLFDIFSYEDVEKVSEIKEISSEKELEKSISAKIIENDSIPNEYRFFINYIREYCQNHAQFYSSEVKRQILNYLKCKYPNKYSDLALASILISNNEAEKISLCLKALYFDKDNAAIYKKNEIFKYLINTKYYTLMAISQLNDIYYTYEYSKTNIKDICMHSFLGLSELDFLSSEDKLICLSSLSKVSYEVMPQAFLKKIDELYRKLLSDIRISVTYKEHSLFIFDYLVFSTCIEDSYETTQVVQRLIKYLRKSNLPLQVEIKYLRLGNALFYNDYSEGLLLTKQAYNLSEGYPAEHKYSAINYSCSLGMCGEYEEAKNILLKEFNNTLWEQNAVSLSATNNYIVVAYLSLAKNVKWLLSNLMALYNKVSSYSFSDQQIIYNNLLAAYIEESHTENRLQIKEISNNILLYENDLYHLFFMHHNMMTYHFLNGNYEAFMHERELYHFPGLLLPYKDFFNEKTNFLQMNINNNWNVNTLNQQLLEWGKKYPEKKYTLYKAPILFGFIERWFE